MFKRGKEKTPVLIGGINVAAITARRPQDIEVDLGAMLDLIDFLSSYPIQGIALFGTTGEFLHFTLEERSRYVALLSKRSRVPVMANVSHSTLDGAVMLAEEAAGAGVSAVLLMPPYYFHYAPETIEAFCLHFASRVSRSVPVMLYNIPLFADAIPLAVIERLMATGLFAGIKDSSGDEGLMNALIALRAAHPFTILCGDDRLFIRARTAGADGAVTGVGCAVPELMVALESAIRSGDTATAGRLNTRVQEFIAGIAGFPVPVAIKTAVAVRGIKTGPHATVLDSELNARLERFQAWFREWLPEVQRESKAAATVSP
jgi:dihydrodipicolinate synthase/N-acetylneuraminate lyase